MKSKMWRVMLYLALFISMTGNLFAQKTSLTGTVTDGKTGEAIPGATVQIKGTGTGTITSLDGTYTLSVQKGATLVFSFVGYTNQEIAYTGQPKINVKLNVDVISLNEVVAIGYGTQKKKDITGSVVSIGADDLTRSPIMTIDAGMQGKLAGVSLQKTSGAPGQAMKIRIRGGGSINYNNEPLYVIDGFIGGDITSVSPQDIERIDILKDASATAIYGSRGANGVVLITTKTAKKGDFNISFDATYGVSNIAKKYNVLDAGTSAELWNIRTSDINALTGQSNPANFTDDEVKYFKEKGGTDYLDLITRTATNENYNLSMAGGTEKLTYMLSGGYLKEQGLIDESFRNKYSVRSNISAQIKTWLDMKFNTYATSENSMNTGQNNRAVMDAYMYPIFWPNKDENGNYIYSGNSGRNTPYYVNGALSGYNGVAQPGEGPNPVQANHARANADNRNVGATSTLEFNIKFSPKVELRVGESGRYFSTVNSSMTLPDGVNIKSEDDIVAQHDRNTGSTLINTNILTYKDKIGKHDFTASAMYEYSKGQYQGTTASTDSLATIANSWYILGNGKPRNTLSSYSESYMQSYMGRFNYSYDEKYLLTATLRVDETSVFTEKNRRGYFPSFAAGWNLNNEDFLKNVNWISNLKLRAGYGETGNQAVGAYATKARLMQASGYAGYCGYATLNGNDFLAGVLPQTTIVDPNLKWETTAQTNLGLDFSVLRNILTLTVDLYNKTTSDVILQRSVAMYNGRETVTGNYGKINNKGLEIMTDWHAVSSKDFSVNVGANLSINRNKVLDLGGADQIFLNENLVGVGMWGYDGNNAFIIKKDETMGLLYGIKKTGLWQVGQEAEAALYNSYVGMPKYEDLNSDNKIDANDRQVIGHTQPKFNYGLNIEVNYKDFSLVVSGVGVYGNSIYNYTRHYMDKRMLNPDYLNRWSPTNPGASQQRVPVGTEAANSYIASQYVEDGSFFKINNLTLSYSIPSGIVNKAHINSLRVYVGANNLLTFTKYTGIDPENSVTSIQSDAQSGIDSFSYPLARTITFGLKTTF